MVTFIKNKLTLEYRHIYFHCHGDGHWIFIRSSRPNMTNINIVLATISFIVARIKEAEYGKIKETNVENVKFKNETLWS